MTQVTIKFSAEKVEKVITEYYIDTLINPENYMDFVLKDKDGSGLSKEEILGFDNHVNKLLIECCELQKKCADVNKLLKLYEAKKNTSKIKSVSVILEKLEKNIATKKTKCRSIILGYKDIFVWYVMLHGLTGNEDEYVGGQYMFELVFPPEFPQKVISFSCKTPNGVYNPGGKICISIGEYHQNEVGKSDRGYAPAKSGGPKKFTREVMNGLIIADHDLLEKNKFNAGLDHGINIVTTDISEKKRMAKQSNSFNRNVYPEIMQSFDRLRVYKVRKFIKTLNEIYFNVNMAQYNRELKKIMSIPMDC